MKFIQNISLQKSVILFYISTYNFSLFNFSLIDKQNKAQPNLKLPYR